MQWYLQVLKNYATFSGRARRKEYWMYFLFNIIAGIILLLVGMAAKPLLFLVGLYNLAVLIPSLAVFVRRMHDTGRSGGWFFLGFIPLIGAIVLLVFTCSDSTPGPNEYGPNPKEAVGYGPGPGYPAV